MFLLWIMRFPEKIILVETDGEMSKCWLGDGNFARYRGVKSRYLTLPNWTIYFYRKKDSTGPIQAFIMAGYRLQWL